MEKGAIQQLATPAELYEQPTIRFVADFIGKVNMFEANVVSQKGKAVICNAKGIGKVDLPSDKACGGKVTIAVRPEKLKLCSRWHPRRRTGHDRSHGARRRLLR